MNNFFIFLLNAQRVIFNILLFIMRKVLFIDTVHPILEERLNNRGFNCVDATKISREELNIHLKDTFGIVIRARFTLDKEFLERARNLKFIARSGSGLENIDQSYCTEKQIKLFNSPEGNRNAVAEHALGMLLMLINKLNIGNQQVKNGIWDREGNRGEELEGKTIGIIGYGNNGSTFAKKLRGFDLKILAHDKYKTGFGDHFVQECTLQALFQQADVVSFHIPLNRETKYFANEQFFNSFAKPIRLLNLSRGKILNTKDLVSAMKSGKVLGACLDVLEFETKSFESFFEQHLPDEFKYLIDSENIILSPHVGGWTKVSYFKLSNILADKILDWDENI
jgi:D-3-phosphoglycerate dehydrogenase